MSTINKQRFAVSFVFTLFLSVGFVVSHTLAGLHDSAEETQLIAKTESSVGEQMVAQKKKSANLLVLQVKK